MTAQEERTETLLEISDAEITSACALIGTNDREGVRIALKRFLMQRCDAEARKSRCSLEAGYEHALARQANPDYRVDRMTVTPYGRRYVMQNFARADATYAVRITKTEALEALAECVKMGGCIV